MSRVSQRAQTFLERWNPAGVDPGNQEGPCARTWRMFWYNANMPVLFALMVQIKQKRDTGVKNPAPRSF